jgi:hypothetical protein
MSIATISFKTELLKEAIASYKKKVEVAPSDKKTTPVQLTEVNKDLLSFMSDTMKLTSAQKLKIKSFITPNDKLGEAMIGSVTSLYNALEHITSAVEPVLEIDLNGKWYPLMASMYKFKTLMGGFMMEIRLYAMLGALNYNKNSYIGDWDFEDNAGKPIKKSITDILNSKGLRIATPEALDAAKKKNSKLLELETHENKVFDASGTGLMYHEWFGWQEAHIGWKDYPSTVVLEPQLEDKYAGRSGGRYHNNDGWTLPFVRVFSMKHKNYFYVDVEDLKEHVFHQDGKDKIVLPSNMRVALESIFNAKQGHIFGDIFHGRHGGIVVLANGPSGVGKTLTAEVFAEFQKRPLYTMEMSEIGTSLKDVEMNLQKIFARAKKWNAVLLFDEADIFLSERVSSDLERSAIVGIFLRLLDYYEGTFFLTTNRGESIDKAFKSRVTLYLNYPELIPETRKSIWQSMLASAGVEATEDETSWDQVSEAVLNGRQIRNQVRLLKLMYPDNKILTSHIMASLDFAAR